MLILCCACSDHAISDFLGYKQSPSSESRRLSVRTTGLLGSGLSLSLSNETLQIKNNGVTSFIRTLRAPESYSVAIITHPVSPTQFCTLTASSGVIGEQDVEVQAACVYGNARGPLIGGSIISPLSLAGNVDLSLGQVFAGTIGATGSTDATGTSARFLTANQITTDGRYLYVQQNNVPGAVRRIDPETRQVTTIANSGATDGITTDGENLYATNFSDCTIRKVNLTTFAVSVLAGLANTCVSTDAPTGPGSTARFNAPVSITYGDGFLFVTEYNGNRVRRIDPASGATITIAGTGAGGSNNGPGASATFDAPHGILFYASTLYVSEYANFKIRKINLSDGNFTVSNFSGTGVNGNLDGPVATAQFKRPVAMTTDGVYLYVTDVQSFSVRRVALVDGSVTTISGSDLRQFSAVGTAGLGGTAAFLEAHGIVSDGANLFVTDPLDFVVRRVE